MLCVLPFLLPCIRNELVAEDSGRYESARSSRKHIWFVQQSKPDMLAGAAWLSSIILDIKPKNGDTLFCMMYRSSCHEPATKKTGEHSYVL